jgi:hypothetical protein
MFLLRMKVKLRMEEEAKHEEARANAKLLVGGISPASVLPTTEALYFKFSQLLHLAEQLSCAITVILESSKNSLYPS